ncbi:lipopolysaccharide biosynthesis protein [Fodinibius halophilus]|uniref:Oligosaccharide flippase family protein n=1 Tax=Fodinibius halophilus TaxID=1736908 RepID=A0A6M1TG65_9BACT|nr:oligosaccharide flippase family protein [Fodinibius halophilus]NGP89794.1 oligosaccharide flippase family protein [Fodinibius halophilus]
MGIIIRQSIRNTIISYIGVALGFIITIWIYPNILLPEQYGLTRVLLSLAMVSTQLANLGTQNTIIRYFPIFRNKENKHHGSLFLSLAVPFIGLFFLTIILYAFRPEITQHFIERSALLVDYYWLILPLAAFILFFHVLSAYVRALYDTVMSSFLMNIVIRVLAAIILVLYLLNWITFFQFMIAFVSTYGIITLWLLIYTLNEFEVNIKPDFQFLRKSLLKSMGNYSLFAFFGGIASILVNNIDIIMLGSLAGLTETGIYAIAFYIGSAITIPRKSVYQISSPLISDAFKKKDLNLIEDIYSRSSINMIIAGGLLFCGVVANIENLMKLLPPAYSGGNLVIIIIASANVFSMATGVNGAIILNSKHYHFDLYSTIFLIFVTIILNYLLIPVYGILGAAIGTATAVILYNFLKLFYVYFRFSMQPFETQILYVLAIGAATMIIISQVPTMFNTYIDLIIRSTIITGLYLSPIIMLNISEQFNQLVFETIKKIKSPF